MGKKVGITAGDVEATAELNDTATARAICDSLPIDGRASRWGAEIYFPIPLSLQLENGQELVSMGDLGYWPEGKAFCIFFGQTPMSEPGRIVPASMVNVIGRVVGEATRFKEVMHESEITLEGY